VGDLGIVVGSAIGGFERPGDGTVTVDACDATAAVTATASVTPSPIAGELTTVANDVELPAIILVRRTGVRGQRRLLRGYRQLFW
jgi:hypothetical protein